MRNRRPESIVYTQHTFSFFGFYILKVTFQDCKSQFSTYSISRDKYQPSKVCGIVQKTPTEEGRFAQWTHGPVMPFEESADRLEQFNINNSGTVVHDARELEFLLNNREQ